MKEHWQSDTHRVRTTTQTQCADALGYNQKEAWGREAWRRDFGASATPQPGREVCRKEALTWEAFIKWHCGTEATLQPYALKRPLWNDLVESVSCICQETKLCLNQGVLPITKSHGCWLVFSATARVSWNHPHPGGVPAVAGRGHAVQRGPPTLPLPLRPAHGDPAGGWPRGTQHAPTRRPRLRPAQPLGDGGIEKQVGGREWVHPSHCRWVEWCWRGRYVSTRMRLGVRGTGRPLPLLMGWVMLEGSVHQYTDEVGGQGDGSTPSTVDGLSDVGGVGTSVHGWGWGSGGAGVGRPLMRLGVRREWVFDCSVLTLMSDI